MQISCKEGNIKVVFKRFYFLILKKTQTIFFDVKHSMLLQSEEINKINELNEITSFSFNL